MTHFLRHGLLALLCLTFSAADGCLAHAAEPPSRGWTQAELKNWRQEAAKRQRRLIVNNDGNEAADPPADDPHTHEVFLRKRTTPLAGTHLDALFYCTGVFNVHSHHSPECEPAYVLDHGVDNWVWGLGDRGPDSLATIVDFCHAHDMQAFWSLRMNDTHDSSDPALLSRWKQDNPGFLMGKQGDAFVAGGKRWSALDYELPEVREQAFRMLRDVATRYDVDGLELDFFRHPVYFRPQMSGQPVTQRQRNLMTDLMRRVRGMVDEVGVRRGRPILIAIRVPDSVECSAAIGLDIVRWLQEDLIDLLVVSDYFRLNPWRTSVDLGHDHGVLVYPCLTDARHINAESAQVRKSVECYRGRALEAWKAGADGIYLFNYFEWRSPLWNELHDQQKLETLDQCYPAGVMGARYIDYWVAGGKQWLRQPVPLPERPVQLEPGGTGTIEISVAAAVQTGRPATVTARLLPSAATTAPALAVTLNGTVLSGPAPAGAWIEYAVEPSLVREGVNRLEVSLPADGPATAISDAVLDIRYAKSGE